MTQPNVVSPRDMDTAKQRLLVCTVGGSAEPVVASLKHWKPLKIIFVVSPGTKVKVEAEIIPLARKEGLELDPGRYRSSELDDEQSFSGCIDWLREINPEVEEWIARGQDYQLIVDFTGGTKCMTAALAVHAHRWPCLFSYVGGSERTKGGTGVVVSSWEQIVQTPNPWDSLGFQAVEEYITLFDQHAYGAASKLLHRVRCNIRDSRRKEEITSLVNLATAYNDWDRFDHRRSLDKLNLTFKSENNLAVALGQNLWQRIAPTVRSHQAYLRELIDAAPPSSQLVLDLIANAKRRGDEGRTDDAVARLYRAIESIAQVALKEKYQINTSSVMIEQLPESLRETFSSKLKNGVVKLALQDAYSVLKAFGDDVGSRFSDLGLAVNDESNSSPLTARNQSILAHGFQRVGEEVYQQLWSAALTLSNATESELPTFPRLAR